MPAASRHAKPGKPARRFRAPMVAAAALTGAVAAFVFLHGGSPATASGLGRDGRPGLVNDQLAAKVRREAASVSNSMAQRIQAAADARKRHLAALAAARRARQQARAAVTPATTPTAAPSTSSSPPPQLSSGGDPAHSPLGDCIRNAEEGGSYAWGPGNGGGAYQFALGTWEHYGGAASEFGQAGSAYQDQIFDNAIRAGGASNWTNYDGC
jgi:hypothetical protein